MSTTSSTTSGPTRITHLIAGQPWTGTAEHQPGLQPGHR